MITAETYTPRSNEEILAEFDRRSKDVLLFDFGMEELIFRLPIELARPHFNDDVNEEEFRSEQKSMLYHDIIAEMRDYMVFAWDKANDERGLSAMRSVQRFTAWLWLLGDKETFAFANDDDNYASYGRPILAKICEVYGFPNENKRGGR